MSEAKGQQHEPSMEEILASIRRIIAEDGETGAPTDAPASSAAAQPGEKSGAEPSPDEILELTEVVEADGSVVSLSAAGAERPAPPEPAAPEPIPPSIRPPAAAAPAEDGAPDSIVSAATAAASVAALSQISALSAGRETRRERDISLGAGHLSLEMLVREELRPILKDWLDHNLPDLVERLVRDEIARLVANVRR